MATQERYIITGISVQFTVLQEKKGNSYSDSVVEGQEPKSAHSDISRIEGGVDRPDIDVDEGVDLQGKLIFYVFSQMTLYTLSMAVIY